MTTATSDAAGRSAMLVACEIFGPTFQGEGPSAGTRAFFLRLSGCNLSCGWCDTPYTWDWTRYNRDEQTRKMTVEQVLRWVLGQDAELMVITGGEPLLQQRCLLPVTAALAGAGWRVEIETNGTVTPDDALVDTVTAFNVSPKLANSGVPQPRRIRPQTLARLAATGRSVFKFVVTGPGDLDEVGDLVGRFGLHPVWIMPEGTNPDTVMSGLRELAEPVLARGWNLGNRLHILLWRDERGR
jgi:7-carboxy-7-deazaguanine synthase